MIRLHLLFADLYIFRREFSLRSLSHFTTLPRSLHPTVIFWFTQHLTADDTTPPMLISWIGWRVKISWKKQQQCLPHNRLIRIISNANRTRESQQETLTRETSILLPMMALVNPAPTINFVDEVRETWELYWLFPLYVSEIAEWRVWRKLACDNFPACLPHFVREWLIIGFYWVLVLCMENDIR